MAKRKKYPKRRRAYRRRSRQSDGMGELVILLLGGIGLTSLFGGQVPIVSDLVTDTFLLYLRVGLLLVGMLVSLYVAYRLYRYVRTQRELVAWQEQHTTYNIRKRSLSEYNAMDDHAFEHEVAKIFRLHNFAAVVSPRGPDGGVDITLTDEQDRRFAVEVKKWATKKVGLQDVQKTNGAAEHAHYGIFYVTTSTFTSKAIDYAEDKQMQLIDGQDLIALRDGEQILEPNLIE